MLLYIVEKCIEPFVYGKDRHLCANIDIGSYRTKWEKIYVVELHVWLIWSIKLEWWDMWWNLIGILIIVDWTNKYHKSLLQIYEWKFTKSLFIKSFINLVQQFLSNSHGWVRIYYSNIRIKLVHIIKDIHISIFLTTARIFFLYNKSFPLNLNLHSPNQMSFVSRRLTCTSFWISMFVFKPWSSIQVDPSRCKSFMEKHRRENRFSFSLNPCSVGLKVYFTPVTK